MDETSLRSLIGILDQHLSCLQVWLYFWTVLVILGCAGEMYFVSHEYRDDKKLWFSARTRGFVSPLEKPSALVLLLEILSVALVVVGISGELYIDRESGDLQTKLRIANGNLMLLLEKQAGAAKDSATIAATSAGKAQASADAAGKKADGVRITVDSVGREAKSLQRDIESSKKKLLEQGSRVDLLRADPQTIKELRALLLPFSGQKVKLLYLPKDVPETVDLRLLLWIELYRYCNWIVIDTPAEERVVGVMVVVSEDATESTRKAAEVLGKSLKSSGLIFAQRPVETSPPGVIPPDTIELYVGQHP